MKNKIYYIIVLIVILISSVLYFNTNSNQKINKNFFALDTIINITLYDSNKQNLLDSTENIVSEFEDIFSKTKINSELYKINNRNNNDYIKISMDLAFLFEASKYFYNHSNNKFDISLYDSIDLWTKAREEKTLPTNNDILNLVKNSNNINYSIYLKNENNKYILYNDLYNIIELENYIEKIVNLKNENLNLYIKFDNKDSKYDFGAIAKGYIADYLKYYLKSDGINKAIINLGGNVLCIGKKSFLKDFNVGINKPFANNEIITTVRINDKSCVTSGIYERYFKTDNDDTIYHHIIDNETGWPVNNELSSVTIISENSIIGDALSTIFMINGYDKSIELLDYYKKHIDSSIKAIFIDKKLNLLEK